MLVGRRLEQLAGVDAVPREFLRRLAASFDRHGMPVLLTPRRGAVAVPGLVEPLSTREQEVLTLLAAGHPNRAIAEGLVIIGHGETTPQLCLREAGCPSRTHAVARARQLGLLP